MILVCPACATRYVVPDNAIGIDGRTVRCAKCRHSWFQEGPAVNTGVEAVAPAPVAAPPPPPPPPAPPPPPPPAPPPPEPEPEPADYADESFEAPVAEPAAEEEAGDYPPEPPVRRVYADDAEDTDYEEGPSSFAHEPPFRPRVNRARMWTWAAAIFGIISFGLIGAVSWYGLPDWMPMSRPLFAEAQEGLTLEFPLEKQDRRTLPDGTEFFGASGKISNIGSSTRTVPMVLIVLRDSHDRIVYRKAVASPQSQLAPGESVTINEALTDVPKAAKFAEFGWKPG